MPSQGGLMWELQLRVQAFLSRGCRERVPRSGAVRGHHIPDRDESRPYLITTVHCYGGGGLQAFNNTIGGPRSILLWRAMSVLARKALMRLRPGHKTHETLGNACQMCSPTDIQSLLGVFGA